MNGSDLMLGFAIAAGALLLIAGGYYIHLKMVMADILAEEKRKLREWAYQEAETRAQERVKEILENVQIDIPVSLINESDINWGE